MPTSAFFTILCSVVHSRFLHLDLYYLEELMFGIVPHHHLLIHFKYQVLLTDVLGIRQSVFV